MVVHTSVPFTIPLLDNPFQDVEPEVLSNLKQVIPNLPEPSSKKFLRWRYSQVSKPFCGGEHGCLVLKDTSPLVILTGDAFSHSNFDGCLKSAESSFNVVSKYLN